MGKKSLRGPASASLCILGFRPSPLPGSVGQVGPVSQRAQVLLCLFLVLLARVVALLQ